MSKPKVRVRIAPSPTGFVHVGTAYISLFNFAFAKKHKGDFILRIEDTDIKRHVPKAEKAVYDGLSWLGLTWNEGPEKGGKYGPYRQSGRLDIYKDWAEKLLKKKLAFRDKGAVRFKNPGKAVSWKDEVRGEISFPGDQIGDFVIVKSDGFPTYNFAVVIDDYLMKISHVIRGEEHISNTPRQLVLYQALGIRPPRFAHVPLLRNPDKSKISKRKNPVALSWYKKEGYLPEALVNFLCLLGWSHPEGKEIFSLDEFVKKFTLERIRKAGPVFNFEKLDWMNGQYIRKLTDRELAEGLRPFVPRKVDKKKLLEIVPLIKSRIKKLSEASKLIGFFFERLKVDRKLLGKNHKRHLGSAIDALAKLDWQKQKIDKVLLALVKKEGFKTSAFFMDLRVAVTGSRVTPPINDSIAILGKEETLKRLNLAMK